MPSKSKAQQRFMGIVHAFNKGELKGSEVSKQVKDVAKSMKKKDTKDYAKTKHKGLPNKVTQEWLKKTIRELVDEELNLEGTCGYGEDGVLGDEPAGPHLLKKKKNESAAEKKKIHAYMVKKGDNPKDAQNSLDKVYDFIKKAYRRASVAKKAEIVSSLSKYESKQFKKKVVSEGVRATKAYNQFQKSRINFLERWGKLKKQLNTLKTESPNDEYLRLEKQLYKFETSFIENSAKIMSSISKISKSNLTESSDKAVKDMIKKRYVKKGQREKDRVKGIGKWLDDRAPKFSAKYGPVWIRRIKMGRGGQVQDWWGDTMSMISNRLGESVNEANIKDIEKVLKTRSAKKIDGMYMDMTTANAIMTVYKALNTSNRKKFEKLPLKKMVDVTWKLVK